MARPSQARVGDAPLLGPGRAWPGGRGRRRTSSPNPPDASSSISRTSVSRTPRPSGSRTRTSGRALQEISMPLLSTPSPCPQVSPRVRWCALTTATRRSQLWRRGLPRTKGGSKYRYLFAPRACSGRAACDTPTSRGASATSSSHAIRSGSCDNEGCQERGKANPTSSERKPF